MVLPKQMPSAARIYVAGHRGLVGSALIRKLHAAGYTNLLTRTHAELDLLNQQAVADFFAQERPEYVFLAAARVGGIYANNRYRAEFIYQNLMMQANVIHQSWLQGVKRLLFLGSSCIYPKFSPQPVQEEYLLTGALEPSNSPYAIAKIGGIEMCWAYNQQYGTQFIPVMPTNLYGPGDNFDLDNSHVLPALIRKCHLAKLVAAGNCQAVREDVARFGPLSSQVQEALGLAGGGQAPSGKPPSVIVWGTGRPKREFLHVDDLAAAVLHLMNLPAGAISFANEPFASCLFNVGTGIDLTIREVADLVKSIVGFQGELIFDPLQLDGTPEKLLDVSKLAALGWRARIGLAEGIAQVYRWYQSQLG